MRKFVGVLVLALLIVPFVAAQPPQQGSGKDLSWVFPIPEKVQPEQDPGPRHVPGSSKAYMFVEIEDLFNPPDWFPEEHGPLPSIIARGIAGKAQACGSCHLMSGLGHPESANLAGLNAEYLMREMADFKSGVRIDTGARMNVIGKEISEEDSRVAAEWFAALEPKVWVKVVESNTVPRTYVRAARMRIQLPSGGTEPIGNRIIEVPEDPARATSRDPHSGFIAYVPVGSLAKGEALVKTGGAGKTIQCAICHGQTLQGLGEVPRITGVSPVYIARQMYQFQMGTRAGSLDVLMKQAVEHLTDDDIIAISAYLASQKP